MLGTKEEHIENFFKGPNPLFAEEIEAQVVIKMICLLSLSLLNNVFI